MSDPGKLGFDFATFFINHPREVPQLKILCNDGPAVLSEETKTWLGSQETVLLNKDGTATPMLKRLMEGFLMLGLDRFSSEIGKKPS